MANITIGHLADPTGTVVVNPNGASAQVALQRGVLYRVVTLAAGVGTLANAAFLNYSAAAAADTLIPLVAGSTDYLVFGMADPQGTNIDVRCFAAAGTKVFFTPVVAIPTA